VSAQPLQLILARNLISLLSVPAFVVDTDGTLLFYNETAGELIGRRFEETGRLSPEQWHAIGPLDAEGNELPDEDVPMRTALRHNRAAGGRFHIRTDDGSLREVDAGAIPLATDDEVHGALITFSAA